MSGQGNQPVTIPGDDTAGYIFPSLYPPGQRFRLRAGLVDAAVWTFQQAFFLEAGHGNAERGRFNTEQRSSIYQAPDGLRLCEGAAHQRQDERARRTSFGSRVQNNTSIDLI
jgi:hypothetical protein